MTVHNHGTEDGPGLACPESRVTGELKGKCMDTQVTPHAAVLPDIRRAGWTSETRVGSNVSVLFYPDGSVRIGHECRLSRSGRAVLHAPSLQLDNGHSVTLLEPITVTPSIECPECGLHGFITGGKWVSA